MTRTQHASCRLNVAARRRRRIAHCFALAFSVGLVTVPAATRGQFVIGEEKPTATATAPASLDWSSSLETTQQAATKSNQPIVVLFSAAWCVPCRELDRELLTPEAQAALKPFARVHLDFDANRDLARRLGVVSLPGLRVLRPNGRAIAANDGFIRTQRLVAFLGDAAKTFVSPTYEALLAEGAPTAESLPTVLATFTDADPALREAAIRRLLPFAPQAAPAVVDAFSAGPLARRLTALDLLEYWRAPLDGIDPWKPETITADRLNALKKWAANPAAATTAPALDPAELASARDQLARLADARDDVEAAAIRERLLRLGKPLLPEIYAAIAKAPTDAARTRLVLLRYRLAASDALALNWPGGLERLASAQVKTRHSALEELGKRITARDTALLMELFSDPDSLVRETALRLLDQVGGPTATDALVGLLKDPDPNVRATVLKTLTESPAKTMIGKVAEYVATEKDPDLIAHAARVFRASKSPVGIKSLYGLLKNDSWRVRAEAVEALTEAVNSSSGDEKRVDFYVTMIDMLDDPDGFVASRALTALERADALPKLDPIARVAEKHPDVAPLAVKILAANIKNKNALPLLRNFTASKDGTVRALAIAQLCTHAGEAAAPEITAALKDPDTRVRAAAAEGVLRCLESVYPKWERYSNTPLPDTAEWLEKFHAGKNRPAWIWSLRPSLMALLPAKDAPEALHAAMALLALGQRDEAMPVVRKVAADDPQLRSAATRALKWLPWEMRLAFLAELRTLADEALLSTLATTLQASHDVRVIDSLWSLLDHKAATFDTADTVCRALREAYLITSGDMPLRKETTAEVQKRLAAGPELQRTVALVLLTSLAPDAALTAATAIAEDPAVGEALRQDALHIQLALLPNAEAEKLAARHLTHKSDTVRKFCLKYLVSGSESMTYLRRNIYLDLPSRSYRERPSGPVAPRVPRGITVETLKPLLKDADPESAAAIGHLLALLGDNTGMPQLLAHYRAQNKSSDAQKMVYNAITALNDDELTPILTEIFRDMQKNDSWELREFYWTIRTITGDKVANLRKLIRTEVGMEKLK